MGLRHTNRVKRAFRGILEIKLKWRNGAQPHVGWQKKQTPRWLVARTIRCGRISTAVPRRGENEPSAAFVVQKSCIVLKGHVDMFLVPPNLPKPSQGTKITHNPFSSRAFRNGKFATMRFDGGTNGRTTLVHASSFHFWTFY